MHTWSFEAAVNARYFDTKSQKLGDEYRLFIFANQPQITQQNLRGMTERFADEHKVALPFVVDPLGELAAKVKADYAIGQRVRSSTPRPSTSSATPPAARRLSKSSTAPSFTS